MGSWTRTVTYRCNWSKYEQAVKHFCGDNYETFKSGGITRIDYGEWSRGYISRELGSASDFFPLVKDTEDDIGAPTSGQYDASSISITATLNSPLMQA